MSTPRDRLIYLIGKSGKKPAAIAREAGVAPSTLSRYIAGDRQPKTDVLGKLAKYFGVDLQWFYSEISEIVEESVDNYGSEPLKSPQSDTLREGRQMLEKTVLELTLALRDRDREIAELKDKLHHYEKQKGAANH